MAGARPLALGGVALLAALVCVGIAVNERGTRSPSALLSQKLYYPNYPGYNGYYPYSYDYYGYPGYGGYPYGAYGGYPGYNYYDANAYYDHYGAWAAANANAQYQDQVQASQYADYVQQQQYADYVNQYNAYNNYLGYRSAPTGTDGPISNELKVAKGTPQLVYTGDLEFGGYRHDITGGNDGGYNAPFDINGDGQYVDNWAKVVTQWKHKKGGSTLKANKSQLRQLEDLHAKMDRKRLAQRSLQVLRADDPPEEWSAAWNGHPGPYQVGKTDGREPWYWLLAYKKLGWVPPS